MLAARSHTLRRAAVVAALSSLLVSANGAAYVRTRSPDGKFPLAWAAPHITMMLRTSGPQVVSADDFDGAARRAAATWSAPGLTSTVEFTIGSSPDTPPGTRFDQVNAISFRTDSWNEPMYPESALALTTVWSRDGQIVDADTEINAADPRFKWGVLPDDPSLAAMAAEVDLQNALTHELGHVIGLSHPCFLGDAPAQAEVDEAGDPVLSCSDPTLPASIKTATMFPSSQDGSIAERDLSPDEIRALHEIYPLRPTPPPSLGDRGGGCRIAPAGAGSSAPGAVAGVVVWALALRRRRRAF
jgi:hypothetical protein